MFPLNVEMPVIKKDGTRTTLGDITGDISQLEAEIDALDERLDTAEGNITVLDGRLDTAEDKITTLTGSIKLKRGAVPGNSENSFDVTGSTIIFAIWSNSAMTITIANEGSSATVLGTLPSGAEINSAVGSFTLKNPNNYSCIIYYMSNF